MHTRDITFASKLFCLIYINGLRHNLVQNSVPRLRAKHHGFQQNKVKRGLLIGRIFTLHFIPKLKIKCCWNAARGHRNPENAALTMIDRLENMAVASGFRT